MGRNDKKISKYFAHRTFKWTIDEKVHGLEIANVAVVIVGFSKFKIKKELFIYEKINDDLIKIDVNNINPYLVEGQNIVFKKETHKLAIIQK